ncbi:hypothetical protein PG984_012829 [Apiospora sp. TS-2023a]
MGNTEHFLHAEEIPAGYTLDPYGLIVPGDAAVHEPSDSRYSIQFLCTPSNRPSTEATDTTKADDTGSLSETRGKTTDCTNTDCSSIGNNTDDETREYSESDIIPATRQSIADITLAIDSDGEISGDEADRQDTKRTGTTGALGTGSAPDRVMLRKSLRGRARHSRPLAPETWLPLPPIGIKRDFRRRRKVGVTSLLTKHEVDTKRLETLANRLLTSVGGSSSALVGSSVIPLKRPRAPSPKPDVSQLDALRTHPTVGTVQGGYDPGARPVCDWHFDEAYRTQAIDEILQEARKELQDCKHPTTHDKPTTDDNNSMTDLYLLDGHQAKALLGKTTPNIPIITERQQPFQWNSPARPIPEFFNWIEDYNREVSVQIPSLRANESSCELRTIRQVHERFLSRQKSDDPWNILDCSCPLPSTLPDFLTGWNCQLLARIREAVLDNRNSAGRTAATREEWAEWRDVEHWALLSEGGHCTAAHMDSHGLATWITIQEGHFGFAWMSRPTTEQRRDWMDDTEYYDHE